MSKIIVYLTVLSFFVVYASVSLWECNRCHQQYQGNSPPYFVKCPATNNTTNHWWIKKK